MIDVQDKKFFAFPVADLNASFMFQPFCLDFEDQVITYSLNGFPAYMSANFDNQTNVFQISIPTFTGLTLQNFILESSQ